jgi:two-component system chemotaxis response regulator CheY
MNTKERHLKVLVVDDVTFIRKVVRKSLSELGIAEVIECSDAAEAVKKLRRHSFDLIISDWNLPTMSGYDLLEFVRNHERLKGTPFLMLTAQADKVEVAAQTTSSISDFLAKPFSAEDLEQKISQLIPSSNQS